MRRLKSQLLSVLLVAAMLACMVGVMNVDNTYAASGKMHLKKATVKLVSGKTYQQKLIDKNGKTIKATKVKWKSKKTSVAKISKKGKITAVKAGTAKMTAKYRGKTYKFTVKVTAAGAAAARELYDYLMENGDDFGWLSYRRGEVFLHSDPVRVLGTDGNDYMAEYYIAMDKGDKSTVYFSMRRKQLYVDKSFEDYTTMTVKIGKPSGDVQYIQEYEISFSNFANYVENCIIKYSDYNYHRGLSEFTIGWDKDESGSWYIGERTKEMMKGVKDLLQESTGQEISELGFTKLQ